MALTVEKQRKLRLKRVFRRRRRKVEELGQQADKNIERLLIRRFERLVSVRRFLFGWVALFVLMIFVGSIQIRSLSGYYQSLQPVEGGVFSEGLVGTFTTPNPLYANGAADAAVTKLVFSGLLRYDQKNQLVGDLAEKYELNQNETRYVVTLKPNIKWHDGQPFTADDVVFTYQVIQNPDSKSPLLNSWRGIKVTKQDDLVVSFDLPNALSSFPFAMTNGIIPMHLLKDTPLAQLRSSSFNSQPVGTGPFKWNSVEVFGSTNLDRQQRISLSAYDEYHLQKPKLDGFALRTFRDETQMIKSFEAKEIIGMSGLQSKPAEVEGGDIEYYETPLSSGVFAFFNNSREPFNDGRVRKALVSAVDIKKIVPQLDNYASVLDSPLIRGQLGYDKNIVQAPFNAGEAINLLESAGWKQNGAVRTKNGKNLKINLYSQNTRDYTNVAKDLQRVWSQLGAEVILNSLDGDDLQSGVIASHDYDVLVYGINIGVDPDVFAYWHSSQASITSQGRLNLSEYRSQITDQALEAGRLRSDPKLRALKYKPFLEAWRADAPALALYQPSYLYIAHGKIYGVDSTAYNSAIDRLGNVHNWMIREEKRSTSPSAP